VRLTHEQQFGVAVVHEPEEVYQWTGRFTRQASVYDPRSWQPSIMTYVEVQKKVARLILDSRRTSTGEIPFEMNISNGMKRFHNSFNGQLKAL
jgi:hypothetical protein